MKVTATHKIGENYIIGDDRCIYRKPYISEKGIKYGARKLKPYKNGYYLNGKYVKKVDIKYEEIKPYVFIENDNVPFD